jgi:hypothetical protein
MRYLTRSADSPDYQRLPITTGIDHVAQAPALKIIASCSDRHSHSTQWSATLKGSMGDCEHKKASVETSPVYFFLPNPFAKDPFHSL